MPHSTIPQATTVDGHEVEVAPLATISYSGLTAKDPSEIQKLLHAAESPGFFYLDLQSDPPGFITGLEDAYKAASEHYSKNPGTKMQDIEIRRDAVLSQTLSLPDTLKPHNEQLTSFSHLCHTASKTLLSSLSHALGLPSSNLLENKNRDNHPSDTALDLISAPTKPKSADQPDTTHTDTGTMTLLFCKEWGNKIEDPQSKKWLWIEPSKGCALVNVADALQDTSGGRLHSCRHAVQQVVDGQRERLFIVYYLRPEKEV